VAGTWPADLANEGGDPGPQATPAAMVLPAPSRLGEAGEGPVRLGLTSALSSRSGSAGGRGSIPGRN
jgi:hypothetical protein